MYRELEAKRLNNSVLDFWTICFGTFLFSLFDFGSFDREKVQESLKELVLGNDEFSEKYSAQWTDQYNSTILRVIDKTVYQKTNEITIYEIWLKKFHTKISKSTIMIDNTIYQMFQTYICFFQPISNIIKRKTK